MILGKLDLRILWACEENKTRAELECIMDSQYYPLKRLKMFRRLQ
jgi:hypothetical protein